MKRKISCALTAALIFAMTATSVFGAISDITINVDGVLQPVRNGLVNRNGSNLIGLREISEILGADDIFWNSNNRTVTITKGDKEVVLSVDTGKTTVNGQEVKTDVSAEIINDTVFVPLRFVSEIFDSEVKWDETKRVISISPEEKSQYIMLDVDGDVTKDTAVYSYDDALELATKKSTDLKNLDDTISYLTEARDDLGNNIRLMDDALESYTALANGAASGGISDSQALQMQVSSTISSTITIMENMKSVDTNKSLKPVREEMIKDSIEVTLKNYLISIKKAQMSISLLEESVALGKENIENLELKLSVGMESEQNVSTAKLEQKQSEANLESAKLSLKNLEQSLKSFLGVDANEDIEVNYEITFDQIDDVQLESYITLKTQNDPSIKALKADVDLAEYNKRIASVTATDSEKVNLVNTVNTAQRKLTDTQDSMATNIRKAYNQIKQLEEQNVSYKAAVQKAIETYNSVVVSYQAGMATSYQVSQAKMGILQAEINVEQNALDYDILVLTFEKPYMLS